MTNYLTTVEKTPEFKPSTPSFKRLILNRSIFPFLDKYQLSHWRSLSPVSSIFKEKKEVRNGMEK